MVRGLDDGAAFALAFHPIIRAIIGYLKSLFGEVVRLSFPRARVLVSEYAKAPGQSGLGLGAQQVAVAGFINGNAMLVASFIEVESGKRS